MMRRRTVRDLLALYNIGPVIILFGVILLCFSWMVLLYKIRSEKQMEIDHTVRETANLTRAFEEHILRTVKSADQALLFIKHQYEQDSRSRGVPHMIREARFTGQQPFMQFGIIDENGNLAANSSVPFKPIKLGDREYFQVHKDFESGKLFISKPTLLEGSHQWSIRMTRRISKPDGSFGGVVFVSVDPYYFSKFYNQVDLGENSVILLIGRDGIVRARPSAQKITLGQNLLHAGLIQYLATYNRYAGHYFAKSPIDGVTRLYSFRALHEYPLIVEVGVAEREILRATNQRFQVYYMVAGMFTAIILGFIVVLLNIATRQKYIEAALKKAHDNLEFQVELRTQELSAVNKELEGINRELVGEIAERKQAEAALRKKEDALRISKELLSVAAGLAQLGPWEYNPGANLFEFGDEFYAIYGTDVTREGCFMTPEDYTKNFVHPDDAWMVADEFDKMSLSKERIYSTQIEHRIIRRDGEIRTIIVRINVIRDADGKIIRKYGANQDITERVQAENTLRQQAETIRHLAYFDSLTGLANRAQLNQRLYQELESARRSHSTGVVMFIDLDDLKMVNDAFGHTCGDEIITAAGARIVAEVGAEAFVARIGGDEFVVILPGINDRQQVESIAARVRGSLIQKHEVLGTHFHMTSSIGIATYPNDGATGEEIVKNADNAMYAAKRDGKNCWRFYTTAMQTDACEKMRLINNLRSALERGEFMMYYQPQIRTGGGTVVGFEALLRWNSSEHGFVPPAQFIPLAEQCGLIHSIGQWALEEACRFARLLADRGKDDIHVAVNISSKQLVVDDFIALVHHAVDEAGIEPRQLELEITESMLMASLEDATRKLTELKAIGVGLSLDDFGTGYSSLTYLCNLPVKTLKIDKSFIDMIKTADNMTKMIGSIIDMAHILNMTVTAEGVETEEQRAYLANNGCDCIQGYLFSRPLPQTEAIQFLAMHC